MHAICPEINWGRKIQYNFILQDFKPDLTSCSLTAIFYDIFYVTVFNFLNSREYWKQYIHIYLYYMHSAMKCPWTPRLESFLWTFLTLKNVQCIIWMYIYVPIHAYYLSVLSTYDHIEGRRFKVFRKMCTQQWRVCFNLYLSKTSR